MSRSTLARKGIQATSKGPVSERRAALKARSAEIKAREDAKVAFSALARVSPVKQRTTAEILEKIRAGEPRETDAQERDSAAAPATERIRNRTPAEIIAGLPSRRVSAETERVYEGTQAVHDTRISGLSVAGVALQSTARDAVARIIDSDREHSTDAELAKAIAHKVTALAQPTILGGASAAVAASGARPQVQVDEHAELELAARRAAAIVGAFQALGQPSTEKLREDVAVEIMRATMPKKLGDATPKIHKQRALPFVSKIAKASVLLSTLVGAFAFTAPLPLLWLAPMLFLPPVATRMASAIHDLIRGVPHNKRKQEIELLVQETLKASEYVRPSELVGQTASALVAGIQRTTPGLDKTWLKRIALNAAPKVHKDAVKAAVERVTPGRFMSAVNYCLGTNLGGKRSYVR